MYFHKLLILPLLDKRNDQDPGFCPMGAEGHGGAVAVPPPHLYFAVPLFFAFQTYCRTLSFCSCTDGLYSFIHKGYTNFDLALHLQHVSDLDGGERVSGREGKSEEVEANWEIVLLARNSNCCLCLLSVVLSSSGPGALSIMHECHNQYSHSAVRMGQTFPQLHGWRWGWSVCLVHKK